MKKLLLSAFALAVAMSAAAFNLAPNRMQTATLSSMDNVKKAPKELIQKKIQQEFAELQKRNAPQTKLEQPTKASDVVGGYTWSFNETDSLYANPDSAVATASYSTNVVMYGANDADTTFMIGGMFYAPVTAKLDFTSYSNYGVCIYIPTYYVTQTIDYYNYNGTYLPINLRSVFYYEGDETNSSGFYISDGIYALIYQGNIILMNNWIYSTVKINNKTYRFSDYIIPYSSMVDNADINGVMSYPRTYGSNSLNSVSALAITEDTENYIVNVGNFDGGGKTAHMYLASDKSWIADIDTIYSAPLNADTTLNYQLLGYEATNDSLFYLQGTGTETTLTFGSDWTGLDLTYNYWLGDLAPATITLLSGEFIYPIPDVYIMGEVGDNTWAPNVGQQMTLDEETGLYTANIECKDKDNNGYDYFSFTTKLADNADDWDGIAQYRFGAVSEATDENPNADFYVTDEMLGIDLSLTNEYVHAFRVAKGEYNLTLNYADMKLKIEKVAPTVKLGDVNGDGDVNVNDVTVLINYILGKNPTPFIEANANVNGDEGINVNDVTALINMILN